MEKKEMVCEYVFYKLNNGILTATLKKGIAITLEVAQKIVRNRLNFIEGKSYPMIIDIKNITLLDKDARDYLATREASEGITAAALLTGPFLSVFIANFFIRFSISKVTAPIKVFTDKSEALEWLHQYLQEGQTTS